MVEPEPLVAVELRRRIRVARWALGLAVMLLLAFNGMAQMMVTDQVAQQRTPSAGRPSTAGQVQDIFVAYVIAVVLLGLAAWAGRQPVVALLIALAIYVPDVVIGGVHDRHSPVIFSLLLEIPLIVFLYRGQRAATAYERLRAQRLVT